MRSDISPLRAAVLLSKELTKTVDDASRDCLVQLINTIRRSMNNGLMNAGAPFEPSSKGRRILRAIDSQKLKAKTIARLVGVAYSGSLREELADLVKAGLVEKHGTFYVTNRIVAKPPASTAT